MSGTPQLLDQIEIDLGTADNLLTVYIDVYDSSLARKWLAALNKLLINNTHLEKNYCFFGFADGPRNAEYLCQQINSSIAHINSANLGYVINNVFTVENTITSGDIGYGLPGCRLVQDKFNHLHRYFEDLQGVSGQLSPYYAAANSTTRWHIRQLNLLCHEFESWQLSLRKKLTAPEWQRPSQLMCWLNAPRFTLTPEDYDLFGIETMNRSTGGVFVGVNKAIGKHHWEVFVDEANYDPNCRIDNLTTTTMRSQLEAAGDFDIEWAKNPIGQVWQVDHLRDFRLWLINNGFDPDEPSLTIGHPQVGQVDLRRSFGTEQCQLIWDQLAQHMNVHAIRTDTASAIYEYHWLDSNYADEQIKRIEKGN
jgi:hypothetical protein